MTASVITLRLLASYLAQKERGQAHLPNLELIRVELVNCAGKAFNVKAIAQVQASRGREGGLAPAL